MIDTYRTARDMLADLAAKKISARELLDPIWRATIRCTRS